MESCLSADDVARYIVPGATNVRDHAAHVDRCEPCRRVVAAAMRAGRRRPAGTDATALQRPARADQPISIADTQLQAHARYRPEPALEAFAAVDPKRYAIDGEIARGGMGRILAAHDRRLGRPIAIKELLVGSSDLRARFEREARITARLQHPAIVNLIEAGAWPTGEPFYVMKLVTGASLDDAIAARPRVEDRLALLPNVIAAADALAYAHSRRIIHRDLKPANVIVGEFGETVVIDWGLAKDLAEASDVPDAGPDPYRLAHGSGSETQDGSVLGTPAYMPPEQALGNAVDERADVYALGAMLYHVLAGAPPYTGRSADAILAEVVAGPPASIAEAALGVPHDLVAIVDRAMAHDAGDRYPSARQLAEDLKRFQTGQLVGAHRYSTWQLVRRWVHRHRTAVAVAAAAVVVLAIVGIASLQRIFHAQAQTEHQRERAETHRSEAEDLLGFMLVDLRDKLSPLGRVNLLGDIAAKAVHYYDRRADGLSSGELAKLAHARRNLGDVFSEQGKSSDALREYRAAATVAASLALRDPGRLDWQRGVASSQRKIGNVLLARGDTAGAVAAYRRAMAITQTLAFVRPADFDLRWDLAESHDNVGRALAALGDGEGALTESRVALAIRQTLAAQKPQHRGAQSELAAAHDGVGDLLLAKSDTAGALVAYRASQSIAERLVASDPANATYQRDLAASYARIADALMFGGADYDPRAALDAAEKLRAISQQLAANDPTSGSRQRDLAASYSRVGDALAELDPPHGPRKALASFKSALAIFEKLGVDDPDSADWKGGLQILHTRIGEMLVKLDDHGGALVEYKAALALAEAQVASDPTNVEWQAGLAVSHQRLGTLAMAHQDYATALTEYRAARPFREAVAAKDPTNVETRRQAALVRNQIAGALMGQGELAAAVGEFQTAVALVTALATGRPDDQLLHQDVADYTANLHDALAAQARPH